MRYFVKLSYDGTNYFGWQIQPRQISIQEVLQNSFSTILQKQINLIGAGRTDTGVHASCYYAHFDFDEELNCEKLIFKVNSFLPKDITIFEIFKVSDNLHARFSAISRTYKYFISQNRNPFTRNHSWYLYGKLNFDAMNEASQMLLKYNDFTSFAKLHSQTNNNICNIISAEWQQNENGIIFIISANRFLRNMVRAIVGTIVDVGKEKITLSDFNSIILSKNRSLASESAPAKGLFLFDIKYNFDS